MGGQHWKLGLASDWEIILNATSHAHSYSTESHHTGSFPINRDADPLAWWHHCLDALGILLALHSSLSRPIGPRETPQCARPVGIPSPKFIRRARAESRRLKARVLTLPVRDNNPHHAWRPALGADLSGLRPELRTHLSDAHVGSPLRPPANPMHPERHREGSFGKAQNKPTPGSERII